jgi:nucleoside-diphosphate-sugar epimerase
MNAKLIFGCGYLGQRVARRWLADGQHVYAVTRSNQRADAWRDEGLHAIVADVTRPDTLQDLPAADTVLYAVGHDAGPGRENPHVIGLQNVLKALRPLRRFIYISSTGVYGDCQGQWVDEETPCHPLRASGKACLAAEELLAASDGGGRSVILRLAGLYGPGRVPRQDRLLAGEPIDAPRQGFLNLIHVDDAVEAVLAAEKVSAVLPRRYLIADGSPVVRGDYYAELARLIGAPPPRFCEPDQETPAAARAAGDKRISNARMVAELSFTLRFPSYRAGLRAIVAESLLDTVKRDQEQSSPGTP